MSTPDNPQPREAGLFTTIRGWGITRGDNGFLGGVVDGLAQRIGMATAPARIITVIAGFLLSGFVLLGYAAAWALLPDRRGNIIIQNFGRGMPNVGALIGIGLFALFGLGNLGSPGITIGPRSDWDISGVPDGVAFAAFVIFGIVLPTAIVGGLIWLIVVLVKRSRAQGTATGSPQYAAPPQRPHAAQPPAAAPSTGAGAATDAGPAADADSGPVPVDSADTDESDKPASSGGDEPASSDGSGPAPSAAAVPPAQTFAPVPPAPAAPPVLPRIPGPGRAGYLAMLAVLLLAGAGVAVAERMDRLGVHPFPAWWVVATTGLGVLAMIVSLTGRKLGFLGFLAIFMALPTLLIGAAAPELRSSWSEDGSVVSIDVDPDWFEDGTWEVDTYDATGDLAEDYRVVVVNGTCALREADMDASGPVARIDASGATGDESFDITARTTYLTVDEGTSLVLAGKGDSQAHVEWADRGFGCDFWDAGGEHLRLTNPDTPTVSLTVYDDEYVNTIVIEEVSR